MKRTDNSPDTLELEVNCMIRKKLIKNFARYGITLTR